MATMSWSTSRAVSGRNRSGPMAVVVRSWSGSRRTLRNARDGRRWRRESVDIVFAGKGNWRSVIH
jgi:hypothetical protein